jgi:hypothetical protein
MGDVRLAEEGCVRAAWREERWVELSEALGWGGERVEVPARAWPAWGVPEELAGARVSALGAGLGWRLLMVEGDVGAGVRGQAMRAVRATHPDVFTLWWWVSPGEVTVAMAAQGPEGDVFTREMACPRGELSELALARWVRLRRGDAVRAGGRDVARALSAHVGGVLAQDGLTRAFLRAFTGAHRMLAARMTRGPLDPGARHSVALLVLLRMVVMYFLQGRGALDLDRNFMLRAWRGCQARGDDFWATTLRPLLFGALNVPEHERDPRVRALGAFPFLNGGLFEPTPHERAHPELGWPQEVWEEVVEGLFERFPFALTQPEGADERWAIDPEALGRVFEGLMYGGARKETGSFYTPRDVVARMVEGALAGWLSGQTGVSPERLRRLLGGATGVLSVEESARVADALRDVRVVDPAVGTGAFLMGALSALRRAWRVLRAAGADGPDPDAYAGVRALVHDHLYGVDVNPTAARLCELRLWMELLSVVGEEGEELMRRLEPLPNLSHRIMTGDALLGALDLVRLRAGGGRGGAAWAAGADVRARVAALADLERALLTAHGADKVAANRALEAERDLLERDLVDARRDTLRARLAPLDALASSKDLFGDEVALLPAQRIERESLRRELDALDGAAARAASGERSSWRGVEVGFGEVMARGGFDVVVMNPPWVRAERVPQATRRLHAARFSCARAGLWEGAEREGVRAPFGAQADLATLFMERALELAAPGGHVAALVPAKLLRGLHGVRCRELLARHTLVEVEDLSESSRALFDATTYPASVRVERRAPRKGFARREPARRAAPVRVCAWRGHAAHRWEADVEELPARAGRPGAPWALEPPRQRAPLARMEQVGEPLGSREALRPRRGVLTGLNEAFVMTPQEAERAGLARHVRPVLGGRDVRAWAASPRRRILWLHEDGGRALPGAPPEALAHLGPFRERLERRSDARASTPHWAVFRVNEGLDAPKVVWRDLSPHLQAAAVGAEVIPLNTLYYLPMPDASRAWALSAWLNSTPARAYARSIAERARGGWRRHFAWVVSMIPAPAALLDWLEGGAPDASLAALMMCRTPSERPDAAAIDAAIGYLYGLSRKDLRALGAGMSGAQEVATWAA